ncbi:MAG: hypothetical protein ACLFTA_02110 [Candidatus Nanohaloarchaea archaeon]
MKAEFSTKHLILIIVAALAAATVYFVAESILRDAVINALGTAAD